MPAPLDTATDAWSRQLEGYRACRPDERVRLALEMSEEVTAIARAGIRHRHPDWPASRVQQELEDLVLGAEAARAARLALGGRSSRGGTATRAG